MPREALRLDGVTRHERGRAAPVVDGASFSVAEGSLVALVGADGAGKTTLMRIMAGILKPQKGEVLVFGKSLYKNVSRLQKKCGYMPQKFGLYEDLTVNENFFLYADLFGLNGEERRERMEELLAITGLAAFTEREAGRLSGGMKQKLGLACALLNHPAVLLLDEPSVGVDPLSRRDLWRILRRNAADEGMTVIVSTTYMDEASLCDSVVVLEEGRVALADTPQSIALDARGLAFSVQPRAGEPARSLQAEILDDSDAVIDAVPEAGGIRVVARPGTSLEVLESRHPGLAWEPCGPTLEDGYLVHRDRLLGKAASGSIGFEKATKEKRGGAAPAVEARDLVKRFGKFTAVDKTTFSVMPGEIFGLLGPNGAGKTTTFKMLCGLLEVTEGSLKVAGVDVRDAREEARSRIGYMSQKFALYPNLSARENLEFFAGAYGLSGRRALRRIASLVRSFGLGNVLDRPASSLPGGVKQRLAMAVAVLHSPAILFLDEPTSGADTPARRSFWRWTTALAEAGTTVIVTTHFMEEALYCDRLLIQDAGRPLILGTPDEVRGISPTMDEAFIRIVEDSRRRASS